MGYQLEASALGTVLPIEWGALSQRQRTNSKTDMKGPRASKTGQAGRTFSQERFFFPQRLYLIIWGSLISIIIDQILQKPDSFKHIGPTHSLSLSLSLRAVMTVAPINWPGFPDWDLGSLMLVDNRGKSQLPVTWEHRINSDGVRHTYMEAHQSFI